MRRPASPWQVLAPVVCLVAGFVFAVSARDSNGKQLRPASNRNLAGLVRDAEAQVRNADRQFAQLQASVSAAASAAGQGHSGVQAAQATVVPLARAGGLTAVRGPGITVILDDAPDS